MTCRELNEFLLDYVEGALAGPVRAELDRHLGVCPDCVRYLDDYREVIRLGGTCTEDDAPAEDVPEALIRAILAARAAGAEQ
jgi:predicted anti-sigma-YlaC factor YlaD